MTGNGSTSANQRFWKDYLLEERIAPWKVLLPEDGGSSILAVGLAGKDLGSLGRSYGDIDVHCCDDSRMAWARRQGQTLGHDYRFNRVGNRDFRYGKYSAIAAEVASAPRANLQLLWDLLQPGGAVVLVGRRQNLPAAAQVRRQGFQRVRQYVFLTDVLLVPLRDRRFIWAGIQLIRPMKWGPRILTMLYRLLSSLGCPDLRGRERVMVARKPGRHLPKLQDRLGELLGTPVADLSIRGGWERQLVQVLGEQGQILGYAKVPETPQGASANAKEGRILRILNQQVDLRAMVPKVLSYGDRQGRQILVNPEDGFGPVQFSKGLTPAHIAFLAALGRFDRNDLTLSEWPVWQEIRLWAQQGPGSSVAKAAALQAAIKNCEDTFRDRKIPCHMVHGDFSPWNTLRGKKGILVVDWEHSEPVGLPFFDLIHFAVSRRLVVENKQVSLEQFLQAPVSYLKIDAEFDTLQKSLQVPAEIMSLTAVYECWYRSHWQQPLI